MKIRPLIIFLTFLASALGAVAAPVRILGLVTDENNEPMEFVSVHIKGTQIGATTGLDGKYSVSVPENDTIRVVFSCRLFSRGLCRGGGRAPAALRGARPSSSLRVVT